VPPPSSDSVIQQGKACKYPRQTPFARHRHRSNHPNASCPRPPRPTSRERENREIFGRLDGSLDAHLVVKGLTLGHCMRQYTSLPCPCPPAPVCDSVRNVGPSSRARLPRSSPALVPVPFRRLDGNGGRERDPGMATLPCARRSQSPAIGLYPFATRPQCSLCDNQNAGPMASEGGMMGHFGFDEER
jgi:hypothetical protein